MPVASYIPVMNLVQAALDPAARTISQRSKNPVCQVVSAAAHADVDAGGMENLQNLVIGAAISASTLNSVLAEHRGKTDQETLAGMKEFPEGTINPHLVQVLELMLSEDATQGTAEFLGHLYADDQDAYMDLIVSLGYHAATCMELLVATEYSSAEELMRELEYMLREFYSEESGEE